MKPLMFVTTNEVKVVAADQICRPFGFTIKQVPLDMVEIQAETGEPIARDKAMRAFEQLQKPLIISDDTWIIPALKGFPGPYMKPVNRWFSPEDWLHLTAPLTDREIILRQIIVYQDASEQAMFSVDVKGILLNEIRSSDNLAYPHTAIASFDGGKHSIAETIAAGRSIIEHDHTGWHELCAWLKAREQ